MTQELTTADLIRAFEAVADAIEAEKGRLCELDGVIGDADHGITMAIGFAAVRQAIAGLGPAADPAELFNAAAKAFLNAVGASAGPLYATALMRAGAAVKGRTSLDRDALVAVIGAMAQGVKDRGKAEPGDKTMLDAWLPAADAARTAQGDIAAVAAAAARAAAAGAEATVGMAPGKGRAARLGERAVGHMDPGAASTVVILEALARSVSGGPSVPSAPA
jgi:dihydroxyacetone kinase-like protein